MLIVQKQLKKVAVETRSGQFLGRINDFELETDTGIIEKYYIKAKNLIPGLFEDKLIINRSQIISFDREKMIVEDGVVKSETGKESVLQKVKGMEAVEPVVSSHIE